MRALTWQAAERVSVENVPDPRIEDPTDVVIRVTSTAICGSDIHLFDLFGPFLAKNDVLGHETMGVIEEVGADVVKHEVGDRVVIPFVIACGNCFYCRLGLHTQCETTQQTNHGTGAALYGYTELYGSVPGGQAERLRVPFADFCAIPTKPDLPDTRYLFLSDIIPTAWQGVEYAHVEPGGTLLVNGLGPVGQFAVRIGKHLGYRVLGVDPVPERRALAEKWGTETFDIGDDLIDRVLGATGGRGADGVLDAVGMESHGQTGLGLAQRAIGLLPKPVAQKAMTTVGVDRLDALMFGIEATRRGGSLSLSGVYVGTADPMPLMTIFDKGINIRGGQCNVQAWRDRIIPLVEDPADPLGTMDLVTHERGLLDAPEMYETFRDKKDGCIKVVLHPND